MSQKSSPSRKSPSAPSGPSASVLIACGGTGGHLYPGIAVAEVLKARGHKVLLLISEKKIDALAASGHPDLTFTTLPALAMPRPWSPKMIGFLRTLWSSYRACRRLIKQRVAELPCRCDAITRVTATFLPAVSCPCPCCCCGTRIPATGKIGVVRGLTEERVGVAHGRHPHQNAAAAAARHAVLAASAAAAAAAPAAAAARAEAGMRKGGAPYASTP